MKIEDKYKKIDEIEHVILRSGMYLGSIEHEKVNIYIPDDNGKMILKNLTIMPSFIKLFDEIVTNSSDESRRKGSKLDTIKINVNSETGEIVVEDNGGIPVVIHSETLEYVPQMIFTNLRAGSNFNDNVSDAVAGTNGLGSKLTAIFSKEFKIETCDGKKSFKMDVKDNMSIKSEPIVKDVKSSKGYTRISYKPDYEKLKMDNIDNDNLLMLKLRAYEIAACNPKLKVFFNDYKIDFKSFKDYIAMYTKNINDIVYIEQEGWRVGITFNDFETQHTSYVNGIRTIVGGTHVDHVLNSLVDVLREKIEKKTKQSIRPSDIRNNIHVFIDCDINNPKFTSQTKEKMINQPSGFDNKFNIDESLAKKILNGDIFKKIIEWAMRKKDIDDLKNIEQRENAVRKSGFYDIPKYRPATSKSRKECSLFLSEGDSANAPLLDASNPKVHGLFPLKGKPENCYAKKLTDVVSQEIMYISRILNLSITKPDYDNMRYDKIVFATDADTDGQHIIGLLSLLFSRFWPELLKEGRVQIFQTPSVIATYKGKKYNFVREAEYDEWIKDKKGYTTKYCKGLGGHDSKTFSEFLNDPKSYITIDYNPERDDDALGMAFDPKRADDRKEWVAII